MRLFLDNFVCHFRILECSVRSVSVRLSGVARINGYRG
jgi:hypothetical protein